MWYTFGKILQVILIISVEIEVYCVKDRSLDEYFCFGFFFCRIYFLAHNCIQTSALGNVIDISKTVRCLPWQLVHP